MGTATKKTSAKSSQWAHTLPAFAPDPLVQLLFPHLEYFGWLSGALFEKSFRGAQKVPVLLTFGMLKHIPMLKRHGRVAWVWQNPHFVAICAFVSHLARMASLPGSHLGADFRALNIQQFADVFGKANSFWVLPGDHVKKNRCQWLQVGLKVAHFCSRSPKTG